MKALSFSPWPNVPSLVLRGFFRLFRSTLTTLTFTSIIDDHSPNSEFILNDLFRFELPRLTNLRLISDSLIPFVRAFRDSKNLTWISLAYYTLDEAQDLEDSIKDQIWPNLKNLEVRDDSSPVCSQYEGLEVLCQRYGIEIILNFDNPDAEDE